MAKIKTGSVSGMVINKLNNSKAPMKASDFIALNWKRDGVDVEGQQIHHSLHSLAAAGHIIKKPDPGKKRGFIYYPLSNRKIVEVPELEPGEGYSAEIVNLVMTSFMDASLGDLLKMFRKNDLIKVIKSLP